MPRAISLFASADGGRVDRAAVLVKPGDADNTVRLKIVDLASFRLLPQVDLALWDGAGVLPSLTAAGGRLAVAGNHTHEIATFAARDLANGKARANMLRGEGISAHAISFVRKEGTLGILLSQRPKPDIGAALSNIIEGDLVFDPQRRGITERTAGWQLVQAPLGTVRVEVTGPNALSPKNTPTTITLCQGPRALRPISLPAGRDLTAYAVVPRPAPAGPLLAVATHQLGQPLLELFDATTGAVVRELSGHVAAIEHLALSDDGRLLASTAGDRTVCVWNLADVDSVVAARGALAGVVFQPQGQSLVVADLATDSPHREQLAVGDRLVGWVRAGRSEPFASLVDFYLQVSRRKPGESIAVARQRGERPAETIQLAVTQGADERKPLVTLFVTRGQPAGWIGWSPLGPYESSGGPTEQLLGWHFNAPSLNQPVRFATADEYQHLRREGLVEHLLSAGSLPDDKPKPLDRPAMSIRLRQPGQEAVLVNDGGSVRVGGRSAALELEIRGLATDQVASVSYRIDDEKPARLAPSRVRSGRRPCRTCAASANQSTFYCL